jgi:phosphopentomutase
MDPNFQELAREIEAHLRAAFVDSEARIKEHIDRFEERAEKRMQMHFENLEGTVRLAAEGYGATLEGIDRRLEELNQKFDTKFGDHDLVLADHGKRISNLEQRS